MRNLKIIIQSESIRSNEADSGASLKFIILGVTRMRNLKIINQSESIRGNEADSGASLGVIILST